MPSILEVWRRSMRQVTSCGFTCSRLASSAGRTFCAIISLKRSTFAARLAGSGTTDWPQRGFEGAGVVRRRVEIRLERRFDGMTQRVRLLELAALNLQIVSIFDYIVTGHA